MALLSEKGIIDRIRQQYQISSEELLVGIGDDCAVINKGGNLVELFTTDTLVEKIHFDLAWHSPELLGRKAAAVNLSDIAAMGGKSSYCLLSLALQSGLTANWLDQFMKGFLAMLAEHKTILIGGDTVKSDGDYVISVTVIGEVAADEVLLRSTAQAGDVVMVSGNLGNAAAGLKICKNNIPFKNDGWHELIAAHLDPVPEIALGRVLAASGLVNSMMDVSDGLATDLAHLCHESGVGAEIDALAIPLSKNLQDAANSLDCEPLSWALSGGEDYRLLFTVPSADCGKLRDLVRCKLDRDIFPVGHIVEGSGVVLLDGSRSRIDISYQGYDHFAKN